MLELELRKLLQDLESTNNERSKKINSGILSDYTHTAQVHIYNNTLDIIKKLESLLKRCEYKTYNSKEFIQGKIDKLEMN